MLNEDSFSSIKSKKVPCDIETTSMGDDMAAIINCFSGAETVAPYSDVSLRLMMRVADLLKGNNHCFDSSLEKSPKTIEDLVLSLQKDQEE